MPILQTHNLSIGYRKKDNENTVMTDLNLSLEQGQLTALVGANGIGKSTLLRTICASQPALQGTVTLDGKNLATYRKSDLARLMSIVFTDHTQVGGLTVRELVALGRQPYTGFLGRLSKNDYEIVDEAIESTGIQHKAQNYVAELSDGERQKVMIAKALAQQTPLIILDEPTAFLDVASRTDAMILLHSLAHKHNKAVLISSHDLSQTVLLADNLWIVSHNREIMAGNTEDLVLSGAMDSIFTSQNIKFDLSAGDYTISLHTDRSAYIEGTDPVLNKWIANALQRNGIAIKADSPNVVTAVSPTQLTINHSIQCHSVAELIANLNF